MYSYNLLISVAHTQQSVDIRCRVLSTQANNEATQPLENSQDPLGNTYENMYLHPLIPLLCSENEELEKRGKEIIELTEELAAVELEDNHLISSVDGHSVADVASPLDTFEPPLSSPGPTDHLESELLSAGSLDESQDSVDGSLDNASLQSCVDTKEEHLESSVTDESLNPVDSEEAAVREVEDNGS